MACKVFVGVECDVSVQLYTMASDQTNLCSRTLSYSSDRHTEHPVGHHPM